MIKKKKGSEKNPTPTRKKGKISEFADNFNKKRNAKIIAKNEDAKGKNDDVKNKKSNRVKAVGASAASTGYKVGKVILLINAAKIALMELFAAASSFVSSAVSGILGFLATIESFVLGAIAKIGGLVSSLASVISGALGLGTTASTVLAVTGLAGSIGSVLATIVVVISGSVVKKDDDLIDCAEIVAEAMKGSSSEVDDLEKQMEDNAKKVYSVLKSIGLSDNHIAGCLGNFHVESRIDPTIIEGIADPAEMYNLNGKKKSKIMASGSGWTEYGNSLLAQYRSQGLSINEPFYRADDGVIYPGIGLGQWTGNNAYHLIKTAESVNKNWAEIDFQCAYMLAQGSPSRGGGRAWWDGYKSGASSVEECTMYFLTKFEGINNGTGGLRTNYAKQWLDKMKNWTVDTTFVDSVVALADKIGEEATSVAIAKAMDECVKTKSAYSNSDIARALVAYAYETQDEGRGNNGTELYRTVHDAIAPSDPWYQSCDRGVAMAVLWSGSDDDFPVGACAQQYTYCMASDRWDVVGKTDGSIKMDDLEPGDVFLINGQHIAAYVTNEIVREVYPNSDGTSVSASYCERSPGVGKDIDGYIANNGDGRGPYTIFRCIDPQKSDRFTDAASGKVANPK